MAHCLANEFAQKLRATNPQFKREVFLRACGIDKEQNLRGQFAI